MHKFSPLISFFGLTLSGNGQQSKSRFNPFFGPCNTNNVHNVQHCVIFYIVGRFIFCLNS